MRLRFHFAGDWTNWWKVDDVFVGNRGLRLLPGTVTDANTGKGIAGVRVADTSGAGATSTATPEDPSVGDGFYWFFDQSGKRNLTASKYPYTSASKSPTVIGDSATKAAFTLQTEQLVVKPRELKATVAFGKQATKTLTVTNTGGAAATLKLKEHAGGTTIAAQGAALRRVKGADWHLSMTKAPAAARAAAASPPAAPAAGDAWQAAPDLPVPTQDNSVDSYDGKIYSGFGFNGTSDTNELYSYDPRTGAWTQRASASDTREAPAHGFVNGKLCDGGPPPAVRRRRGIPRQGVVTLPGAREPDGVSGLGWPGCRIRGRCARADDFAGMVPDGEAGGRSGSVPGAAALSRRLWRRMPGTLPSWPTARHG